MHPRTSPPARGWASLAYDRQRNVTLLFGGRGSDSADRNDTWIFDGANWTAQSPLTSPPSREGAVMAFDSASDKMVLFGGVSTVKAAGATTTTVLNDTWTWDGTNWTQEQPITAPPGRFYSNMSHDNQDRPTLFGGAVQSGAIFADTWQWDGTNRIWQPLPAAGPSPRYAAAFSFDAASQRIILFSGRGTTDFPADMWAFDGTTWQPLSPTATPSPRAYPAMCDGSLSNPPTFMGGGRYVGPENAEAWTWGVPTPHVQLNSVASKKLHGNAGPFDVDLPLSNSPGIECRSGGASGEYTLVFTFSNSLTNVDSARVISGTGSVSSSNIDNSDAHNYLVNLTGVGNAQTITVSLTNVRDSAGDFSSAVSTSMGVLIGDVNGNGAVSNTDVASVKAQVAAPVTESNFRNDVSANGVISNTDVSAAKAQVGTTLP